MLIVFFLFFTVAKGDDGNLPPSQFLHKTPSKALEKMLTEAGGINLAFNLDSREDAYNDIRRSVPEVRIVELEEEARPLEELTRMQDSSSRFVRSTGPSFDRPIYDFMIPAGRQEQRTTLAVLKFTTSDSSVVSFSVAMDRLKWFKLGEAKQSKKGNSYDYEVPILLSPGVEVRPELTKNSVYKFNIEARQGDKEISSRVRVEIFSFSPTTKRTKPTETNKISLKEEATTSLAPTTVVEGSGDGQEEKEESNDLVLSSPVTTPEVQPTQPASVATMVDDQLLTTTPKERQIELEGSGREKAGESDLSEQEDEEDPLSEVVTMATQILQRETKDVEISVSGTKEGIIEVESSLNRGDMLRGVVILGKSRKPGVEWLTVSTDRPELVSVRPGRIEPGGRAYLFCNHPDFEGDIPIKISVSDGSTIEEEEVVLRRATGNRESSVTALEFAVPEDAPSGTIIGSVGRGDKMKIVGRPGFFALVGDELILSCSSEAPCLDYETERVHYLLLLAKDGSMKTTKIKVQDTNDNAPRIEPTDSVIRLSDGRLIMPFAVQILDKDSSGVQENVLSSAGDAADFLRLEKVEDDLYQVRVEGSPTPGRYELVLQVDDGAHHSRKTHKTIRVLVQNSHSHAHFRRGRYERNVTSESILPGMEVVRVELEGVPIDEARFVILAGNTGWLSVDDYSGSLSFTRPQRPPRAGTHDVTIGALNRESGRILAKTTVSISVSGTGLERNEFEKALYEKTLDREQSTTISIRLGTVGSIQVDSSSVLAIDDNGQRKSIKPAAISVEGDTVTLEKGAASTLRVVRLEVRAGQEKAAVVFHLVSSDSFIENKRKMATRPVFPPLSEVLEVVEELPVGYVVSTVPAVHPLTGELLPIRLEEREGFFALDQINGVLKVAKRMDYEDPATPREVLLKFIAGEQGYESTTEMKIRLVDIDDNPPLIEKSTFPGKVSISEDAPKGTEILKVKVSDKDAVSLREGLAATLEGPSKNLFEAIVDSDTISIKVAGRLDREETPKHVLRLVVFDAGRHPDSLLITVDLKDENDNSPEFSKDIYNIHAVENWPAGLVLDTLKATDEDSERRGQIVYFLDYRNSKYFGLNETTGELTILQDLMGLAKEGDPYVLTAVATDGGSPPRNSTVPIRITVSEPRRRQQPLVTFQSPPPMDFVLQLGDPLPADGKIYRARTAGDGRNIKYSLQELFSETSHFRIDEMSGDVMLEKPLTRRGEHILVISALHVPSGVEASRFLRVQYTPATRPTPHFPESQPLYFLFREQQAPLGRVKAIVDNGGDIFYYLIPTCSPYTGLFSLNSSSGELSYRGAEALPLGRTELCVLASNKELMEMASLVYRKGSKENIVVEIVKERQEEGLPDLDLLNNTVITLDQKLNGIQIRVEKDEASSFYNFSLTSVSFLPSESVLPLSTAAPLPSLFFVSPQGLARPSCSLATQPPGIYSVKIRAQPAEDMLTQEFHLVAPTSRLRFIFDRQLMPLAKEAQAFETELKTALDRADPALRLILDSPRATAANISRSSMCFHAAGSDSLLSAQTIVSRLSTIGDLFRLYNKFGVVDIAMSCEEPAVPVVAESDSLSSPLLLFVFSVLAFSSLFFFLVCVYFCFVRRYRDYLKAKEKAMKGPPQAVPSTPTFVLAPPIVQPPLGYWE